MTIEAEIGVMHLQTKEHQRMLTATRTRKESRKDFPRVFRESMTLTIS